MTNTSIQPSYPRVVLRAFGDPGELQLELTPRSEPGPGELRVRVLAASVQFTDTIIRRGNYPGLKSKPPLVPGYDVVGEVDAIGEGVTGFALGDRVAELTTTGSYAAYRLLDAAHVTRVPTSVDPAEAAALVLSYMTAYQLIHRFAKVQSGQRVLVHGAGGACGSALLELLGGMEVEVWGTCSARDGDRVRAAGATPIDYRNEDFVEKLEGGVDVVFDAIGEGGFARSWSVLRSGGLLAAYGFQEQFSGRDKTPVAWLFLKQMLWNLWPNGKRASFYSIAKLRSQHPEWFREDLAVLMNLLATGKLRPTIAERIGFGAVVDAHRRLESGGVSGKLVLIPEAA